MKVETESWRPRGLAWPGPRGDRLGVAIVGGGTPFVLPLVEAMRDGAASPPGPAWDLRLLGRDPRALACLAPSVRHLLGDRHAVCVTDDAGLALEGAEIVIVQPRIGGLSARAEDEELAATVGAPADEGLGPGGLRAALRATPVLRGLAADLRRRCPEALVVVLTNPLSSTVSVLHGAGVDAVGVCELPLVTADEVADRLGVSGPEFSWSLTGLCHRAFLYALRRGRRDLLPELVEVLRGGGRRLLGGIDVDVIEQVGAVPLKYHALLSGASCPGAGRGRDLARMRLSALRELAADPWRSPPSVAGRPMPWYRRAVLPVLLSLSGRSRSAGGRHLLDVVCDDGIVREVFCHVDVAGVRPLAGDQAAVPDAARTWVERFSIHEQAINRLLASPTRDHLAEVLHLDPATPGAAVAPLLWALGPSVSVLDASPVAYDWLRA